ncbi:MAG TPA: carbohydrate ABC transporter permease [Solirubrobacteraceae bacterium]|nr:carbohydrate ABC transporter permease [Solirubrobacteraceae bacterium]
MTNTTSQRFKFLVLLVACVPFIYPFAFMFFTAMRPSEDYLESRLGLPTALTLEHVTYALDNAELGRGILNSMIAVGTGVAIVVVVSALGAYWFLRHSGRVANLLLGAILSLWIVPFVIYIIPLFVMLSDAGLTDNLLVLGAVYGAINVPFGLYLLYAYFRDAIPSEILQAAEVDGASGWQTFVRIVLPLSRPALATLAALAFVWTWGDLVISLILIQSSERFTLTVAASTLAGRFDSEPQANAAAALIALLPILIVFLFAQRAIRSGLTAGFGK